MHMVEQLDSDYVYDEKGRIALGWVSVEEEDKQGELIKIDDLYKAMLLSNDVKGSIPINDSHSNRGIGKIVNFYVEEHPELKKKGIKAFYKIFSTSQLEDKVWSEIKSGKRSGLSIGGFAYGKEYTKNDKGEPIEVPTDISLFEVSSVDSPANPYATNVSVNLVAKGEPPKSLEMETIEKFDELIKQANPWAVCTSRVGREDKEKYERCVLHVKEQQGMKKDADSIVKSVKELFLGDKMTDEKVKKDDPAIAEPAPPVEEPTEGIGEKLDKMLVLLEKIAEIVTKEEAELDPEKAVKNPIADVAKEEGKEIVKSVVTEVIKMERPLDTSISKMDEEEDMALRIAKGEKIDIRKIEQSKSDAKEEKIRNFFKK